MTRQQIIATAAAENGAKENLRSQTFRSLEL